VRRVVDPVERVVEVEETLEIGNVSAVEKVSFVDVVLELIKVTYEMLEVTGDGKKHCDSAHRWSS
jgi:hypothetical protein